jgi:hypothetical protein
MSMVKSKQKKQVILSDRGDCVLTYLVEGNLYRAQNYSIFDRRGSVIRR